MVFEFDGEKYRQASPHQKEWGKKLISSLQLAGNERILDLGCGDGTLTAQLAELVPNGSVLGIDASSGMIETACKNYKAENLKFELMDINEIDFESEFDVIFSNATLHWVKDHKKLFANTFKALKPGGYIRFNFAGDGNCSNLYAVLREVMAFEEYSRYFEEFDWPWYMPKIEEYRTIVAESDFKDAKIWGENADRYFANVEEITRWIDQPSIVPIIKFVEDGKKQGFRDAVVERMIQRTTQDDGTCFETFRRINVFAKK